MTALAPSAGKVECKAMQLGGGFARDAQNVLHFVIIDYEAALVCRCRVEQPFGRFPQDNEIDTGSARIGEPLRCVGIGFDRANTRIKPKAIAQAQMREEASRRGVALAKGAFSPTVSLRAEYQYAEEPSSFIEQDERFAYGVRVTAPIFLGGLRLSRVREARAINSADRRRITVAERQVDARVTIGWQRLTAARANIVSSQTQVRANALALDGVRREAEVGVRTTLDVLDAEQEYLDAQVALANAERDARATTYELLASIGAIHLQE